MATNEVKVQAQQTLFDIAMQELGSVEGVFALALLNGISVTEELIAGQILKCQEPINKEIRKLFQDNNYKPASGIKMGALGGIGYWEIGNDFVVGGSVEGIGFWTIGDDFIIN